ncbi:MAG: hypothetical protein Q4P06_08280 [Actinomycetaceae bacterium]|nr:hypothetical protein [Actinomycetaceae bacterium]
MKFFEFAEAMKPLVPGKLTRAPYLRELISMFTTVTEDEWGTDKDPVTVVTDSTLDSMTSRDSAFTRKLAQTMHSRLNINNFIDLIQDLDDPAKVLIAQNLDQYGLTTQIDLLAFDAANELVDILREKAKITTDDAALRRQIRIHAALATFREELLVRSRGCQSCGASMVTQSNGKSKASPRIVFLDSDTPEPSRDDFAVLCLSCANKYSLAHSDKEIAALRRSNAFLLAQQQLGDDLAPLGLDKKLVDLLKRIKDLPRAKRSFDPNYVAVPLEQKLSDEDLLSRCSDAMAIYQRVIRVESQALESSGEFRFTRMLAQIKTAWWAMLDAPLSEAEIFSRLSNWIADQTGGDRYASEVLVAYMIQICELFNPRDMAGKDSAA